jgi:hypothetical protein
MTLTFKIPNASAGHDVKRLAFERLPREGETVSISGEHFIVKKIHWGTDHSTTNGIFRPIVTLQHG